MEEKWQFRKLHIRIYLITVCVLSVLLLTVMTAYAHNKIVIIDGQDVQNVADDEIESKNTASKWKYDIQSSADFRGEIVLPIPEQAGAGSVETDIRYDRREIKVSFPVLDDSFLYKNPPFGDFDLIEEATGTFDGEKAVVLFKLKETALCDSEFVSLIHGGELRLRLQSIAENECPVVMVDPSHGGGSYGIQVGDVAEKDIILKIANRIKALSADRNYRIVLTRNSDSYIQTEAKIDMVNNCRPDLFIGLRLASDIENTKNFGMSATYYSGYYRHGLQNAEFADIVLRETCSVAADRGIGLFEATEDDVVLMTLDVPGTVLYAGYLSNPEELSLLTRDDYIEKIATGVINALDKIYAE